MCPKEHKRPSALHRVPFANPAPAALRLFCCKYSRTLALLAFSLQTAHLQTLQAQTMLAWDGERERI